MKILLMNIPLRKGPRKLFPVGLAYVATAMKSAGWDFDLYDIEALRPSDEEIEKFLTSTKYDVVLTGVMVSGYKHIKRWAKVIKEYNPDCKIIVGNSAATSIPSMLVSNTEVDVAVLGEGDEVVLELLEAIKDGNSLTTIGGICLKYNGILINTGKRHLIDIDKIPNINFDIFDVEEYIKTSPREANIGGEIRALPITTSRGCVANCNFCYHVFKGERYRYRKPEAIVGEIVELQKKYNINYVLFWDELTFFSKKQALALSEAIIDSGIKINFMARCRANLFQKDEDVKIIEKMREAGCCKVQFSLENGDNEILKAMNKKITAEQFDFQCRLFEKAGLPVITSLVLGYPGETPETIKKSIELCQDNNIYPSVGYLLPQPGSPIYDEAIKRGAIKDEEEYILKMGDRQDLLVNLTGMSKAKFTRCVKLELARCNKTLGLEDKRDLLKTETGDRSK